MCARVRFTKQAIVLFALLVLGFAIDLVAASSTGKHFVRKTREGCSVGEVITDFSDDQRLADGGTYLLQPQQMCSGCLTYLETCFFYGRMDSNVAINVFRMQVGVFRMSTKLELQGSLQTVFSSVQQSGEERGCLCHSLNPLPMEEDDIIGVLFERNCTSESWGTVCPIQPVSTSADFCSVLYYNQTATSILPDALTMRNHCLSVMINVASNCTTDPSPVPQCSLMPGPRTPILTNSEIIGVAFGGAAFLLLTAVLFSVILVCYKIQRKPYGHSSSADIGRRERHLKRSNYRSMENRALEEESGEAIESISRARLSSKHRRAARALATPSSDGSFRHSFRNRGYADSNGYSLVGPSEIDTNSLVESADTDHQHQEDEASEDHAAEPSTITASITQSASVHYEYTNTYEGTFWIPANQEEELRAQFGTLNLREILRDELQIKGHLGSGQFGNVRKGVWQTSTEEMINVAVKCLAEGSTERERIKFLQEAAIMGQFKHPNIVSIFGIVTTSEPLMIVCEVMLKGDLQRYLRSLKPSSGNIAQEELAATLLSFCRQVAAGMGYLAHKSFVHRDLAARNVLVSVNDVCKIADFGLSRDLQDEEFYTSSGGKVPVKWTAPEALCFRTYSTASDVWSYGILLYEIWALGIKPYHHFTNKETLKKILSGYRLPPPPGCPQSIYRLMLQCWHPDTNSRPTFFNILLDLQRPDFQLLKWTLEDVAAYREEARTIGTSVEVGQELFTELQQLYSQTNEDGGF